jgi:hypothetical protein
MSKYSDIPPYWLNKWVTQELRDKSIIPLATAYITDLDGDENVQLPFMMVSQQSPESSTPYNSGEYQDLPFCVWTAEQKGGHDQPWTKFWTVTYVFYANNVSTLFEIATLVHDLTNREDWAASDLNYAFRQDETYPWDFKNVCFDSGTGPAPATDEGGRNAYMCIIDMEAVYEGPNRNESYGAQTGLGRI